MSEIKIRTIPRSNEKAVKKGPKAAPRRESSTKNAARIFIALSAVAFAMGALGYWHSTRQVDRSLAKLQPGQVTHTDRVAASISRHMYNSHLMEQMMKRKSQMDAQNMKIAKGQDMESMLPEDTRSYGVQMDQENTAERLYEDLNVNRSHYGDSLDDKIHSRLANRKFVNEAERAERIAFVKAFIRSAYEKGYEVTLDQNLVVVGVRKIRNRNLTIDQVLDRIAKQEQAAGRGR